MLSIGEMSRQTGVKIPTIRYYENIGVLTATARTSGNQRRYDQAQLKKLRFIRHARDLGFSIDAISALIDLQEHPDRSCAEANAIARRQRDEVRARIQSLQALEIELARIVDGCEGAGTSQDCYVLASLSDHQLCSGDHKKRPRNP